MHSIIALVIISLGFAHSLKFHHRRDVLKYDEKNNQSKIPEEWIDQPLDHFNANNRSWKMRYFKRLDLWKPNGPIYLYINGEWEASPSSIESDSFLMCQLAKETNGALFSTEHRYYGESWPVNVTTDISSMQYLSSKQALADLAVLIKFIKSDPKFKSSKLVTIGGSYAGNLAAWMRVLYPELVDAAVSCSAPVLAKKNFYEYLETVHDVYEKYGSPDCLKRIQTKFNHYAELLKTSSGIETLKREMNICTKTDMNVKENQQLFFEEHVSYFEIFSQSGSPDAIKKHCEMLSVNNRTRLTINLRGTNCHEYDFKAEIERTKMAKASIFYSWLYQTCTEFGYYQTTTSNNQPFSHNIPLEYYIKTCQGLYGENFNEKRVDDGVSHSNAIYGGTTPNVTNVVFTHGDMDPWHRLGVLEDLSDTVVVRITNGTSHCAIMTAFSSEPIALTKDREYVKGLVKKWIKQN